MSDRVIYRRPAPDLLSTTGNTDNARGVLPSVYEGLVVDVIFDHLHPDYSNEDGYNVGSIKVRIFDVNQTLADELLPWADPIDTTIQEYPLIGEMVAIHKIRGNFFYTKKIAIARRLQENGLLNLNSTLSDRGNNSLSNSLTSSEGLTVKSHKFGEYFRPDSRVRSLKHFEGDIIFQGRMGQSIRFGSSQLDPSSDSLAPNVIIRAGQGKGLETDSVSIDSVFGILVEDINKDESSIWLVSDQVVPFEPATIAAGSFVRSIANPPQEFSGAQAFINSGKVVINAKNNHIMMFSNDGIHINSYNDTTIDTDKNILMTANLDISFNMGGRFDVLSDSDVSVIAAKNVRLWAQERTSIGGKQVFIGSTDSTEEPMVGGKSLAEALKKLVDALLTTTPLVLTPSGPGQISPKLVTELTRFKTEVLKGMSDATFNSRDNFVSLENQPEEIETNDFENGKQVEYEKNSWKTNETFYKVI